LFELLLLPLCFTPTVGVLFTLFLFLAAKSTVREVERVGEERWRGGEEGGEGVERGGMIGVES
jgi:hypothetical protein